MANAFPDKPKSRRQEEETNPRRQRIPLGVARQKLSLSKEKQAELKARGVVPRWINDKGDRLSEAMQGGYQFETDPALEAAIGTAGTNDIAAKPGVDSRISRVVGTTEEGKSIRAYLMTIPKEFYEEDQQTKAKAIEKTERTMKRGVDEHGNPLPTNDYYIPQSSGPSIEYRDTE